MHQMSHIIKECVDCDGRGFVLLYNNTRTDRKRVKCLTCDGAGTVEREAITASTLEATAWLRKWHPERLSDWLARHPEISSDHPLAVIDAGAADVTAQPGGPNMAQSRSERCEG